MALTTTRLLSSINLKGALPTGKFTDQELLDLAYDCLLSDVQPLIIGIREEYFLERYTTPIVANKTKYRIPDRASGQKLREVKILRSPQVIDLPQMQFEDRVTDQPGQPNSFYMESNYVSLYPIPQATADTLEICYYLRCSKLVPAAEVGVITAIDTVTGIVTASNPSTWTTASSFDLTSRKNAGESLGRDLTATAVSTTSITFALVDLPSELTVGDYVSLAGEAFVIQIMDEAVALLAMLTVVEALNAMGSMQEMQAAQGKAEQLRSQLIGLITSRVIGSPKRFSPMI